jgi:PAS domain S-box-containing protein
VNLIKLFQNSFIYSEAHFASIKRANEIGLVVAPIQVVIMYMLFDFNPITLVSGLLFVFSLFTWFQFRLNWKLKTIPYLFQFYLGIYMFVIFYESATVFAGDILVFAIWSVGFIISCQSFFALTFTLMFGFGHILILVLFQMSTGTAINTMIPYYAFAPLILVITVSYNSGYIRSQLDAIHKSSFVENILNEIEDGLILFDPETNKWFEPNDKFKDLLWDFTSSNPNLVQSFINQHKLHDELVSRDHIIRIIAIDNIKNYEVAFSTIRYNSSYLRLVIVKDISFNEYFKIELEEYENKVNKLEAFYQKIFNATQDVLLIISADGIIKEFNDSFKAQLGWDDNVIETYLWDCIDPNRQLLSFIQIENFNNIQEFNFVNVEGEVLLHEVFISPFDYRNDKGYLISAKNISKRKRLQDFLRDSTHSLFDLLNNVSDVVYQLDFTLDGTTDLGFVSSNVQDVFGIGNEEFYALYEENSLKSLFVDHVEFDSMQIAVKKAKSTLKPQVIQYSLNINDEVQLFEESIFPYKVGESVTVYGIIKKMAAIDAVTSSIIQIGGNVKESYKHFVTNFKEPVVLLDSDDCVQFCNEGAEKLLSGKLQDIVGNSVWDFLDFKTQKIEDTGILSVLKKKNFILKYSSTLIVDLNYRFLKLKYLQDNITQLTTTDNSIFGDLSSFGDFVVWTTDLDIKLNGYNSSFLRICQNVHRREPVLGESLLRLLEDYILTDEDKGRFIRGLENVVLGAFVNETIAFTLSDNVVYLEIFFSPVFDEDGNVIELSFVGHNVTQRYENEQELLKSVKEKEILLKEVHHRVKNNLQVISSILSLQSSYIDDPNVISVLKESQNRINSMSYIHESLYQRKSFEGINFSDYLRSLAKSLVSSYGYDLKIDAKLLIDIEDDIELNLDQGIPMGLILNEIITNSFKYAFGNTSNPKIIISLHKDEDFITFVVADNGSGYVSSGNELKGSLGMELIHTLVEQLDGNLELTSVGGMKYLITFKVDK